LVELFYSAENAEKRYKEVYIGLYRYREILSTISAILAVKPDRLMTEV
jgi:hypothetical protein